jgi:predicted 3-demethylubiquinone-9 3-methyltransferase (glyoxalase superfamily)
MTEKQKIATFLWFDTNAEEAVNHYLSIFENSKVLSIARCGDVGPGPKDSVLTIKFQLEGQEYIALNGGPMFKFTEAISLLIYCDTQDEVDHYWSRLSAGGSESDCGWLKDKFGLSWQVCPRILLDMISDKDQNKSSRAMAAMMTMQKMDIKKLKDAFEGRK